MIFTMAIYVGVFLITCIFGAFVIPRFDRPLAVSPARAVVAVETVASAPSRSSR